jgi:diguanylate cyclase (GGDEF)-like protein
MEGMDQASPPRAETRRARFRPSRSLRTGLRVFALGCVRALVIIVASLVVLVPLSAGQRRAEQVSRTDLAILQQSAAMRATLVRWQAFLEPKLDAYQAGVSTFAPADIASGSELTKTQMSQATRLAATLRARGVPIEARDLDGAAASLTAAITALTPIASGVRVSPEQFTRLVGAERAAYSHAWQVAATISEDVARHTTTPDVEYVADRFRISRALLVSLSGAIVLAALLVSAIGARGAVRRQREREAEADRLLFGADLQQALELATTERDVYDVAGRALREAVPDLDAELLIADSSNAHFRRVFGNRSDADHAAGCGVVSPHDCPAAIRGHTMQFPSSEAISACPYLRDRPSGTCSAVCVPASIAGGTVSVLHATGPDGVLPAQGDLGMLQLSARRSAERIALLRAFDKSEMQARTDPLTGLLNRRSLENRVRELHRDGVPYAVAYGDLDHFKALNDADGHEAGDHALRLFARVMRDAVRPADIVGRYGGEEFVIVLPDCETEAAIGVLERVRERLALGLANGRVPEFTVSFGVATSADGSNFTEILAAADHALLAAKAAGRDRILLADESSRLASALAPMRPPAADADFHDSPV